MNTIAIGPWTRPCSEALDAMTAAGPRPPRDAPDVRPRRLICREQGSGLVARRDLRSAMTSGGPAGGAGGAQALEAVRS